MPAVSILTPVYNRADMLHRCVESVRSQSFQDWELLLVDDGSTDNTPAVMAELAASEPRIRTFHRENGGCGAGRNVALQHSDSRAVALLDSDDAYLPGALEALTSAMEAAAADVGMVYGDFIQVDLRTHEQKRIQTTAPEPRPMLYLQFMNPSLNPVLPSATFIRRTALATVGQFREDLPNCEDLDMWTRLIERFDLGKAEGFICYYSKHGEQLTAGLSQRRYCRDQVVSDFLSRLGPERLFPGTDGPRQLAGNLDTLAAMLLRGRLPCLDTALQALQMAQDLCSTHGRAMRIDELSARIPRLLEDQYGEVLRVAPGAKPDS
jgi:glycosyltransferase involved in cell wall biosynthesis